MTTLVIVLIVLAVLVGIWLMGSEKRVKKHREKEMNTLIPVQVSQLEKYLSKGLGDSELEGLINEAKSEGKNELMYPRAKYNDMFLQSIKDYKEDKSQVAKEVELVKCPKCKSTQITAQQKGYSATKGLAGAFLTGGVGLLAGFIGSGSLTVHCIKCGHKWKAGSN